MRHILMLFIKETLTITPAGGGGGASGESFLQGGSILRSTPLPLYIIQTCNIHTLYTEHWPHAVNHAVSRFALGYLASKKSITIISV